MSRECFWDAVVDNGLCNINYYHVNNRKDEDAEMACAGKSTHLIVRQKVSGGGFTKLFYMICMYEYGGCLQFWQFCPKKGQKSMLGKWGRKINIAFM